MIHFGFSYVGLIFLGMLFVPNSFFVKNQPKGYENYVKKENKILLGFERTGQVLVCCLSLIFSDFNLRPFTFWSLWLVAAFLLMIAYEGFWIRYYKSEKNMSDFYASFMGFPLAGATLPVLAFGFLGIYGTNIFLIVAVIILGIGHIGIHMGHRKEACPVPKKGLPIRIMKAVLIILAAILLGIVVIAIGFRNYHWIRYSVKSDRGVEEECYIELGGQNQYVLMRGDDTANPVIIWIHGGPAGPDTTETFYFSNYLKDSYTVIAWNQRGCGRTYYKNKKTDPDNETATFEQIEEDLDQLVEYARERFKQEKVILVGHSFGTMVGSKYAIDHPEKVSQYVGVGQMGALGSDLYAYQDALKEAKRLGDDTKELENAIEAYQKDPGIPNMLKARSLADAYHKVPNTRDYIPDALTSPYFGVDDLRWVFSQTDLEGFLNLNKKLFDYILEYDVYDFGLEFKIPVGFISGSCDWVTPVDYTRDYYEAINAPYKNMELIEGWGHMVTLENPNEFARELKNMIVTLDEE